MAPPTAQYIPNLDHLTTAQAAMLLGVSAQTLRRNLCERGHFLGVRPVKLPNRLLRWNREDCERVLRGETLPTRPEGE